MKLSILGGVLLTCAAAIPAAQTGAKPSSTARQKPQTITVIGCVAAGPTAADPFTLATIANNRASSGAPPARCPAIAMAMIQRHIGKPGALQKATNFLLGIVLRVSRFQLIVNHQITLAAAEPADDIAHIVG